MKRKKRKRLVRAGQPLAAAAAPNQQWAIDFVQDRLASGRTIRVLTVLDTFTRECLALEVDSCLPSRRVTRTLDTVIFEHGRPEKHYPGQRERTDLTPLPLVGKIAASIWPIFNRASRSRIRSSKASMELRDECLNTNWFRNPSEARRRISNWRHQYNHQRPHSSLDYRTLHEFAQTFATNQKLVLKT